jgi:hypothetical protein
MRPCVLCVFLSVVVATQPSVQAFITSSFSIAFRKNHASDIKYTHITALFESLDNNNNETENEELITKEMFLREMLADPSTEDASSATVKRKKKNGSSYRIMDNRDSLPFLVKVATPDPYTNNDEMKQNAKKNTENAKKNGNKKDNLAGKKRHNLIGMDGKDSIDSSIYTRADDGSMHKIVGEFALDKSTNCGDIIQIGDGTEYLVQKARCQYKYAGGKRFVMTRKILEVKEIKRVVIEQEIKRIYSIEKDDIEKEEDNNHESHFE